MVQSREYHFDLGYYQAGIIGNFFRGLFDPGTWVGARFQGGTRTRLTGILLRWIQELMETDLHRVIRSQELSDDQSVPLSAGSAFQRVVSQHSDLSPFSSCQYFLYQTLRGLKALHSAA